MTFGRLYLAGPMTGRPDLNFPAFHAEAKRLRALGYDVVSPAEISSHATCTWEQALREDLAQLLTCDAIALLDGWEYSRGAILEHHVARALGMRLLRARDLGA